MQSSICDPDGNFEAFLEKLRNGTPGAWRELVKRFRKRLINSLLKKTNRYPREAFYTQRQFVEEVFEESLLKFYDLFQTGRFNAYSDLEALIVTISGYKLKEGFAQLRRERKLYVGDSMEHLAASTRQNSVEHTTGPEEELLLLVQESIGKLDDDERELLVGYYNGEELQDIAKSKNISSEACRKRKQRALEKLKTFVLASLKTNLWFLWPIMMSVMKT